MIIKTVFTKIHVISIVAFKSYTMFYFAFGIGLFLLALYFLLQEKQTMDIIVSDAVLLDDGSYYLRWGYNNRSGKSFQVDPSESSILVLQGGALLLSKQPPHTFLKGKHLDVMEMIALEGSEIEWYVKNNKKKICINSENNMKGEYITNEDNV